MAGAYVDVVVIVVPILAGIAGILLFVFKVIGWLGDRLRGSGEGRASRGDDDGGGGGGQVNLGDQNPSASGDGIAVGQVGNMTINKTGVDQVAREEIEKLEERVRQLERASAPEAESLPVVDASAIAEEADANTVRIVDEALTLQRQNRQKDSVEKLMTAYREDMSPQAKAAVLILAGNGLAKIGDLSGAESQFSHAVEIARRSDDKRNLAAALGNLAAVQTEQGRYELATKTLREAAELSRALGDDSHRGADLNNLSIILRNVGDLDGAEQYAREALEAFELVSDNEGKAAAYSSLGLVLRDDARIDDAFSMFQQALAIARRISDRRIEASVLGSIGSILFTRGDLSGAKLYHEQALDIDRALGNRLAIAQDFGNLGSVYRDLGDLERAEALYREARRQFEEIGVMSQVEQTDNLLRKLGERRND